MNSQPTHLRITASALSFLGTATQVTLISAANSLLCQSGTPPLCQSGNKYFPTYYDTREWAEALEFCKTDAPLGPHEQGTLIEIRSEHDRQMLIDLTPRTYVWLGGSDSEVEGEWRWVSNGELFYNRSSVSKNVTDTWECNDEVMYSAWENNYNPFDNRERSAVFARHQDGLWNDGQATSRWAVVCEFCASGMEPVDQGCPVSVKRYERLSSRYDWGQAQVECRARAGETEYGNLAKAATQEDWDKISLVLLSFSTRDYWLGATDDAKEGEWRWVSDNSLVGDGFNPDGSDYACFHAGSTGQMEGCDHGSELEYVLCEFCPKEWTLDPTAEPTLTPTSEPASEPTSTPTSQPTTEPTPTPTSQPTSEPTPTPTSEPTSESTLMPTSEPTSEPMDRGVAKGTTSALVGVNALTGNPVGVLNAQRIGALFLRCEAGELEDTPCVDVAPIECAIASTPVALYDGGMVFTLLVFIAVCGAHAGIAFGYALCKGISMRRVLHTSKLTLTMTAFFVILTTPVGLLGTVMVQRGTTMERLGSIAIMVGYVAFAAVWSYYVLVRHRGSARLVRASDEALRKRGWLKRIILPVGEWKMVGISVEDLGERSIVSPSPSSSLDPGTSPLSVSSLNKSSSSSSGSPAPAGDPQREVLQRGTAAWWMSLGAPFFVDYSDRFRHWMVLELTIGILLGVIEAIIPSIGCTAGTASMFALLLTHMVCVFALRPFLIPLDKYLNFVVSPVMTVAGACKVAFVETKMRSLADTMETVLVGLSLVLLLRSLLDIFTVFRKAFRNVCACCNFFEEQQQQKDSTPKDASTQDGRKDADLDLGDDMLSPSAPPVFRRWCTGGKKCIVNDERKLFWKSFWKVPHGTRSIEQQQNSSIRFGQCSGRTGRGFRQRLLYTDRRWRC